MCGQDRQRESNKDREREKPEETQGNIFLKPEYSRTWFTCYLLSEIKVDCIPEKEIHWWKRQMPELLRISACLYNLFVC